MSQPPPIADPVRPALYYAPPVARARRTVLIGGIIVSLIYAFGAAMIVMGLMMTMSRYERDGPTFVAIGVFAIVLATGVLVTLWLARR